MSLRSGKLVRRIPNRIGIWKSWRNHFEKRGKPEKNVSEQGREPTTNSPHIRYGVSLGFESGAHWRETSVVQQQ